MTERARWAAEHVPEPGSCGRAPSRGPRTLPASVAEGLQPGEQPPVGRLGTPTLVRRAPGSLPRDGVAVERRGARRPDHRVDRRPVILLPGIEGLSAYSCQLEVTEQVLRRPVAPSESRGRSVPRQQPIVQSERLPHALVDDADRPPPRRHLIRLVPSHRRRAYACASCASHHRAATSSATRTSVSSAASGLPSWRYRTVRSTPSTSPPTATTREPRSRIQAMIAGSEREPAKSNAR